MSQPHFLSKIPSSSLSYTRMSAGMRDNFQTGAAGEHVQMMVHRWNAIDSNGNSDDCFGHGSALASIAVGSVFGIAKAANVVGVRVLDCNGQGVM